ncbi:MAG TPA: helix-turn-helix domain-containing protein [Clostridiales bacterium]|nr:helix-turn-helix domain-containing protein [Clostridiales bacterium]
MKLSLWMIAEHLKQYQPRLFIKEGRATISGVRFISEDLTELPQDFVYISYGSYAFTDLNYADEYMLIHQNDFLFISGLHMETLLNKVMTAFAYYNGWESSLWQTSGAANPYQQMIDLSTEVLDNPICMGDYEGNVLALSRAFGPDDVDDRWHELYDTGIVPTSYTGPPILTTGGEVVPDWLEEPREYQYENGVKYICANIYADQEQIAGLYIQQHRTVFTPGHQQLAVVLCDILTKTIAARQKNAQQIYTGAIIVRDLLEAKSVDPALVDRLSKRANWQGPWQLLVIRNYPLNASKLKQRNLLNTIRQMKIVNIALDYHDDVVVLVDAEDFDTFLEDLHRAISMRYYSAGLSLPYQNWSALRTYYQQALFAMEQGGFLPDLHACQDYAFEHLLTLIDAKNRELELCHPALNLLKEYDRHQHTELYETLFHYLLHERNLVKTAAALFIHRNSLIYRVKRIGELVKIDLDDPKERQFILISYWLRQQK